MKKVQAWSTLTIKGVDEETRRVTGIASTPSTDRQGDIVLPEGAKFKLPIPLLSQHRHDEPIGEVLSAIVTPKGIEIEAVIPKDSGLGYVEKAWLQIKAGLLKGLSVGFRPLKFEPINTGLKFLEWEWFELSAVTIPANARATITSIKSFDQASLDQPILRQMARHDAKERAAAAIVTANKVLNLK